LKEENILSVAKSWLGSLAGSGFRCIIVGPTPSSGRIFFYALAQSFVLGIYL